MTAPIQSDVAKFFFCDTYQVMIKGLKIAYLNNANHHFAHAKLLLS